MSHRKSGCGCSGGTPVCGSTPNQQVQTIVPSTASCDPCKTGVRPVCASNDCHQAPVQEEIQQASCFNPCSQELFAESLNSFNFPACAAFVELVIERAAERLVPGQVLYKKGIGALHIDSVDGDTVVAKNLCDDPSNLEAGTPVASGIKWTVGFPPYAITAQNPAASATTPYLMSDLVVPAVGNDVTIKVSTVNGISNGDVVEISGLRYKVKSIVNSTTLILTNEGDGGEVNSVLHWDSNCDGIPEYPVVVITGTNACDKEPVASGIPVVCNAGAQSTIPGPESDEAFLMWNPLTQQAEWRQFNCAACAPCTTFSCCLILDPENESQEYILTVADSSIFTDPDYSVYDPLLIIIDDREFIFIEAIDETHIRIKPNFEVTEVEEIDGPGQVCIADCCRLINEEITEIQEEITEINTEIGVLQCAGHFISQVAIPQTFFLNVPVVFDEENPQTFNTQLSDFLGTITMPETCPGKLYTVEAHVSIACIPAHLGAMGGPTEVYNELELAWSNKGAANTRITGKSVWNTFAIDGYDIGPSYPTFVPEATMKQLEGPLIDGESLSMDYHHTDLAARTYGIAAGVNLDLELYYRCAVGDNNPPTDFEAVSAMVSGIIRVYRQPT